MSTGDLKTDYQKAIEELPNSPMFNLSLSSKELFHSNFLYWLYSLNKDAFKSLIETVLEVDTKEWDEGWVAKREYNNFDLCIVQNAVQDKNNARVKKKQAERLLLVVENKVKSIPTKEQLERYNEKIKRKYGNIENIEKILLSLTETNLKVDEWKYVSYQSICEWLLKQVEDHTFSSRKTKTPGQQTIQDDSTSELTYEEGIIRDYATFVKGLIVLTDEWKKDVEKDEDNIFLLDYEERDTKNEDNNQVENLKIEDNTSDKTPEKYKQAKALRIHDLYGKYRFAILRNKLTDKLSECTDSKSITTQIAYTNSQPILEVKITGVGEAEDKSQQKESEAFFISIQGKQYRHAINARDKGANTKDERVKESKEKCTKTQKWHWFMNPTAHPNNEQNKCFPKNDCLLNSGQRKNNNVCSFVGRGGVNYIYQYKKISPTATVKDILNILVNDVKNIITNHNKS